MALTTIKVEQDILPLLESVREVLNESTVKRGFLLRSRGDVVRYLAASAMTYGDPVETGERARAVQ